MQAPDNLPQEQLEEYNLHYNEAQHYLDRIMRLHEHPRGLFAFFGRRKARRGIEHLITCLEIVPTSWQCMWLIGKAYQALDDDEASLSWFEKALELEKENPDVPREAALQSLALGLGDKAKKYAEEALRRQADDPGLVSNLALALLLRGDLAAAAEAAGKAAALAPEDPVCRQVLAYVAAVQSGDKPKPERIGPEG